MNGRMPAKMAAAARETQRRLEDAVAQRRAQADGDDPTIEGESVAERIANALQIITGWQADPNGLDAGTVVENRFAVQRLLLDALEQLNREQEDRREILEGMDARLDTALGKAAGLVAQQRESRS